MKKTIRINIGGIVFHIDEDAFQKLENYLNAINMKLIDSEGAKEIVSDVESRIAELFQEKITPVNEVISIDDVDSVIAILGDPEVFEETSEPDNSGSKNNYVKSAKRFYRDSDSRILGGICTGIGHYFKIDPVIVRIAFILAFFAYGTGPLIYFILWIVIPEAKTAAQKLEMRGEQINLENIQRTVYDEVHNVKENFKKWKGTESYKNTTNSFSNFMAFVGRAMDLFLRIMVGFFAVLFIIIGLGMLVSLTIGVFFGFHFGENSISIHQFLNYFADNSSITIGLFGFSLLFGIPLIGLVWAGIKILFKIKTKTKIIGITALVLWFVGLGLTIASGIKFARNFENEGSYTDTYVLDKLKSDTLLIRINSEDEKNPIYENANDRFDDWKIYDENGKIQLLGAPKIDIFRAEGDKIEIIIKHQAHARYKKDANLYAKDIKYNWIQSDSLIKFSPYFTLPENQKFRNQRINIIIKLPVGKVIYLDNSIEDFIYDIENIQHYWDNDMLGKKWIMTERGLSLFGTIKEDDKVNLSKTQDTDTINDMKKELKKIN